MQNVQCAQIGKLCRKIVAKKMKLSEKVIHIEKCRKIEKNELCTELYTLSTKKIGK